MKICYIITKADEIGGAQVHVLDLCNYAKLNGHDVFVIVGEKGLLVDHLNQCGVETFIADSLVREISPKKDFKSYRQVRNIVKHKNPDIIALHSSKAGIIGRLVSSSLNIPVVFTAHGWAFADGVSKRKCKVYASIERLFARKTNSIITVSNQDKLLALNNKVSNERQMVAIHNGVKDIGLFHNDFNREVVNMIMVARFSEQKDHETLFKALFEVRSKNWTLSLVGKGRTMEHLKSMVSGTDIEDKIKFLGERSDVPDLLKQSDIFLLISNWEGYPMTTLEAMSAGLPIIASDVGGTSEAVTHDLNGYLVKRKDHKSLSEYIDALIENPQIRQLMSVKNRSDYLEKHTVSRMCESTFNVYNSVLKETA